MEENKYICPKCGSIMFENYEKPALNLVCPKCGCNIATTRWEDIDLDDKDYEIVLKRHINPTIEQIKTISMISGMNFVCSKKLLCNGGILLKLKAIDINEKIILINKENIQYTITPFFPYK